MTTLKINNKRELANRLAKGSVSMESVSMKLNRIVTMWAARKEVVIENGYISLVK